MKILMLRPCLNIGGAEVHMVCLAKELNNYGVEVQFATKAFDKMHNIDTSKFKIHLVPLYSSTPFNLIRSVLQIIKIVRKEKIDLLHSHHRFTTLVSKIVGYFTKIPYVATVHDFYKPNFILHPFWKSKFNIAPSISIRDYLVNDCKFDKLRTFTIQNGIPHDITVSDNTKERVHEKVCIGCLARLVKQKGVEYFVESIPLIKNYNENTEFIIYGDGPEMSSLKLYSEKLGLNSKDLFYGYTKETINVVNEIDILVVPSLIEPFGIVALEAMRAKKAVIASEVGGLREIVVNNKTGYLVQHSSAAAIFQAIKILLDDPVLRKTMGENGFDVFMEKFTAQKMAEKTQNVYKTILNKI